MQQLEMIPKHDGQWINFLVWQQLYISTFEELLNYMWSFLASLMVSSSSPGLHFLTVWRIFWNRTLRGFLGFAIRPVNTMIWVPKQFKAFHIFRKMHQGTHCLPNFSSGLRLHHVGTLRVNLLAKTFGDHSLIKFQMTPWMFTKMASLMYFHFMFQVRHLRNLGTVTFYYFMMLFSVSYQQSMKNMLIYLPHPRHRKRFLMSRVLIFPVTAMYDCHASVKTQQNEARKKKCKNAVVVVQMLCGDRRKHMLNLGRDLSVLCSQIRGDPTM